MYIAFSVACENSW